jgi:glucose/arabinose dehydrogenase
MKHGLLAFLLLVIIFPSHAQSYTVTTPVTGLQYPIAFTFTPDGRYLVTLKHGIIQVHDNSGNFTNVFYDLTDSTYDNMERGLLGIEVDPDFSNNHYVYAYYNHSYPVGTGPQYIRVVRFTELINIGSNPVVILSIPVSNSIFGFHVGGNVRFRPSEPDKIYVSIGEIGIPAYAQQLDNPFGKILRISINGTIPPDNPFYDDGDPAVGNDDRIWSYGLRNPYDFAFGPNDSLYATDNGANAADEVNVITKGMNYGWKDCEGYYTYGSTSILCDTVFPSHVEPVHVFQAPVPALTGLLYYTGTLMPEFSNHLIVAGNNWGNLTDLTLAPPAHATVTNASTIQNLYMLTTVKQGADGCIYAMKGGYTENGAIYKICPEGTGLSEIKALPSIDISPNPFSEDTRIGFSLESAQHVKIALFDITGRPIIVLLDEALPEGRHTIRLSASQRGLSPGFYLCSLQAGDGTVRTARLAVIK